MVTPRKPTPRTTLRRLPKRGFHDAETIHAILDEGFLCHVAFTMDGAPFVIPTLYGRRDDHIYFHGSAASRTLKAAAKLEVSVCVTLVDALVLARSAFHHSMNYRSVVLFGQAELLMDLREKNAALRVISDHLMPGRWDAVRPPNEVELKQTGVMSLRIDEASAKIRNAPPVDDEEDMTFDTWAGLLPLHLNAGTPSPDEKNIGALPGYITAYHPGPGRRRR